MKIGYKYFVLLAVFLFREKQYNLIGEIKCLFRRRYLPHCLFELLIYEKGSSFNDKFKRLNEKWKNFIMKIYFKDITEYMKSIGLNQSMTYDVFKNLITDSFLIRYLKLPETFFNDFMDGFYNFKNQ